VEKEVQAARVAEAPEREAEEAELLLPLAAAEGREEMDCVLLRALLPEREALPLRDREARAEAEAQEVPEPGAEAEAQPEAEGEPEAEPEALGEAEGEGRGRQGRSQRRSSRGRRRRAFISCQRIHTEQLLRGDAGAAAGLLWMKEHYKLVE